MTASYLSDGAKRIVEYATAVRLDVRQMIEAYGRWHSAISPSPERVHSDDLSSSMLAAVRERLGIVSDWDGALEVFGEAINVLVESSDEEVRNLWHATKVAAVGGKDREKKLISLQHLQASDYEDDSVIAALVESLSHDDETLALAFAVSAAPYLDPLERDEVLRLLFGELEACERKRLSRAAFFGTAIDQMYEHHPTVVPPQWLLESWVADVTKSDDPASYAAAVDVVAKALGRSQSVAAIERWLGSSDGRQWMFALAVVKSIELSTLQSEQRRTLCHALAKVLDTLTSSSRLELALSADHLKWLEANLRSQLAGCV